VALDLDAPRFWDLVIGALERLAGRHEDTTGPPVASPRGDVIG
jgi:hypothetical protein